MQRRKQTPHAAILNDDETFLDVPNETFFEQSENDHTFLR